MYGNTKKCGEVRADFRQRVRGVHVPKEQTVTHPKLPLLYTGEQVWAKPSRQDPRGQEGVDVDHVNFYFQRTAAPVISRRGRTTACE